MTRRSRPCRPQMELGPPSQDVLDKLAELESYHEKLPPRSRTATTTPAAKEVEAPAPAHVQTAEARPQQRSCFFTTNHVCIQCRENDCATEELERLMRLHDEIADNGILSIAVRCTRDGWTAERLQESIKASLDASKVCRERTIAAAQREWRLHRWNTAE